MKKSIFSVLGIMIKEGIDVVWTITQKHKNSYPMLTKLLEIEIYQYVLPLCQKILIKK